jgi:translation initiation factor IF-3
VVDAEGKNIGVFDLAEALRMAEDRGVDLIEIAPSANPPVAKLIPYGKYKYEEERSRRKQRAKERRDVVKTIRITFGASLHDLEIKMRKLVEFLNEGYRCQVEMRLRGREKAHQSLAYEKLQKFLKLAPMELKILQERRTPNGFLVMVGKS